MTYTTKQEKEAESSGKQGSGAMSLAEQGGGQMMLRHKVIPINIADLKNTLTQG